MRTSGSFGHVIAVCDGMGSRPNARAGSKAACLAVREAATRWARVEDLPVRYLAHLVEVYWRLRIFPIEPSTAVTTCLFAVVTRSRRCVVGGLGDGMVLVRTGDELKSALTPRGDAFANQTTGLGLASGARDWTLLELPDTGLDRTIVLATDGVSEDLIPERYADLIGWLAESFRSLSPTDRAVKLAAELREWPTPMHSDDKTMAVLFEESIGGGTCS